MKEESESAEIKIHLSLRFHFRYYEIHKNRILRFCRFAFRKTLFKKYLKVKLKDKLAILFNFLF